MIFIRFLKLAILSARNYFFVLLEEVHLLDLLKVQGSSLLFREIVSE